jgi:CRP-like cAMP-binding protein
MQNNIPVVPGIVPMLPNEIKQLFYKMGEKQIVTKGFIDHDEFAEPDPLVMIHKGCFFHGVKNRLLNKDIAISLLPQGRMVGFVNFFSRERMPSCSGALMRSEIFVIPYKTLYDTIRGDFRLLYLFSEYQERCNKSDMYSMLWIMTHPIEERIEMLFTATLLSFGYGFSKETLNEWIEIPLSFTRTTIAKVAYASTLSINRNLSKWAKEGVLKKENKHFYIKPIKLLPPYEWIMERS